MRRYRTCNVKNSLLTILSLTCLILYSPLLNQLPGGNFTIFSLEYLPTLCYGVASHKQTLDFYVNLDSAGRNKRILLWTYMWKSRSWNQPLGQTAFSQCPEQRCELTVDRCLQPISDAVLLYWPNFYLKTPNGLPAHHPPWQTWVVGVFESEANYENPKYGSASDLDGRINWIFSHRFDADIFMPYHYFFKILDNPKRLQPVIPRNISSLSLTLKARQLVENYDITSSADTFTLPAIPQTNFAQKKTKLALWFVSNCQSTGTQKRMQLFKELQKYIPIDVFSKSGSCQDVGAKEDPCRQDEVCSAKLMSSYKFYLSFENSECNYYITEKFFNPLRAGTIPVAYGAPLKHYEAIAPQDSFLHVDNYTSIEAVAEYIKYLDENDEQYNRYLKWKESHVQLRSYYMEDNFYCKLCSDLWDIQKKPKVYHRFSEWWNKDRNCNN